MKYLLTALILSLTLVPLAEAKPSQSRKVLCNRGWPIYMKANKLQDVEGAKAAYQAKCIAGDVEPPTRTK